MKKKKTLTFEQVKDMIVSGIKSRYNNMVLIGKKHYYISGYIQRFIVDAGYTNNSEHYFREICFDSQYESISTRLLIHNDTYDNINALPTRGYRISKYNDISGSGVERFISHDFENNTRLANREEVKTYFDENERTGR